MKGPRDPSIGDSETLPASPDSEALYGPALAYGSHVGDYVVMARGPRGGFATVYRARRFDGGPDVALKVLHRMLVHSPNMIRRFEREGMAIQRIDHPNVVELLGFGDLPDGRPYFVMPWIDGGDLREELARRGVFSVAEVGELLEQLCGALSAAHAAGIVHRDVKTSNVVVAPSPAGLRVRLVDFGVAKLAVGEGSDHSLTSTGTRIGTPNYMAPEQVISGPIDHRTDIYSLGVVMFELLTGRLPFTAARALDVETQHLHAPIPRAAQLAPVSTAIDAVITRCLAKRPEDRFDSVEALWRCYREAMMADTGVTSIAPGPYPGSSAVPAVAVHVQLVTARHDLDDDLLDAIDEAIDAIETRCARDLSIARVESSSVLAIAVSPPGDDIETRAMVLEVALELAAGQWPGHLAITVHSAPVEASESGFVGGELLQVSEWIAGGQIAGVIATAAAFAGLSDRFAHVQGSGAAAVRVLRSGA